MKYQATGISERRVLFTRPGRAAKGEPSRVSRYYKYATDEAAWRAWATDTVGKGKPERKWA